MTRHLLIFVALLLTACRHAPPVVWTAAIPDSGTSAFQATGLRYFGYFGSNYIAPHSDETADHANVIWVDAQVGDWRAQVTDGAERGQGAVLNVFGILFDAASMRLRPDYHARWDSLRAHRRACAASRRGALSHG